MCGIFSGQSRRRYANQTRSVRLSGHSTSVRMEGAFWDMLEELARHEKMSVSKLLNALHEEAMDDAKLPANFTSLVRCACLTYASEVRASGRPGGDAAQRTEPL